MENTDPPSPGATLPPGQETSEVLQKSGHSRDFDLAGLIDLDEKGKKRPVNKVFTHLNCIFGD